MVITPDLRARAIELVLTDADGVLTDGGVYYSERGEELKRFHMRDGMGFELLRNAGISAGIITRESTRFVPARAKKLGLELVMTGVRDKLASFETLIRERHLNASQVAFIGDDVNDLSLLRAVGLSAAPADAHASVLAEVLLPCRARGGHGAFRELADFILSQRGDS